MHSGNEFRSSKRAIMNELEFYQYFLPKVYFGIYLSPIKSDIMKSQYHRVFNSSLIYFGTLDGHQICKLYLV